MNWKQPIDRDIDNQFGEDHLCKHLFIILLWRARNTDMTEPEYYRNKPYILKKGQVIFGRNTYAKEFRCSPSGIDHALLRLSSRYSKVTCTRTRDYTIVEILSYDTLIDIGTSKRASKEQVSNTTKNVESVKSENIYTPTLEKLKEISSTKLKKNFILNSSKEIKLKARLKTFSEDQIIQGFKNACNDEFYSGSNSKWKGFDVNWYLKNDENIEKMLNLKGKEKQKLSPSDEIADLRESIRLLEKETGRAADPLTPVPDELLSHYKDYLNLYKSKDSIPAYTYEKSIKPQLDSKIDILKSKGIKLCKTKED